MLNLDYKIATKVLALRLKKVLPSIINDAQTGYMKGRFIGENIRLISDILHVRPQQNLEGIALFIDLEKAFDSLEWDFLLKTLDTFQFGREFKSWVKILYTNTTSCTINNGYASNWFELHHDVTQGCPVSGLLFVLAVEILSIAIRASRDIKGIQIANREIKLSQYADDTTVFCRDTFSLGKLLDVLNTFGDCSGLKLNATKSEANCGLEKMLIERICLLMLSGHKDLSMHWRQLFHITLISVKQTISPLKQTSCRTFLIYGHNVTYRCMVEYYLQKP